MTFTASEMNGLFLLDKWGQQVTALAAYTLSDPWLEFWDLRLCHLGKGNLQIFCNASGKRVQITLHEVLYVPYIGYQSVKILNLQRQKE